MILGLINGGKLADTRDARLTRFYALISQLEKRRKSRILSIIQCGESEENQQICSHTFRSVYTLRREMRNVPVLEVLLQSGGGDADIAYTIMRYLRRHCQRLNVIVPLYAKSAATLMALGADTIYMGEFADLGPLDVQMSDPVKRGAKRISPLDEFKSAEYLRDYAVELLDSFMLLMLRRTGMSVKDALHDSIAFTTGIMRPLYEQINPLEIGEHMRSLAIGEDYANRLLARTGNPRQKEIVKALVTKYPSHSFVIDAVEAREIGLPVRHLEPGQENMFLDALNCIQNGEESFYGFAKEPEKKETSPRKSKIGQPKRSPGTVPRPTEITAAK
jgi:hypothetical protein